MVSLFSSTVMVSHDGGLFDFEVGRGWSRTLEADGTQVLWDDSAGSGTLRVSSITAKKQFESTVDAIRAVLSESGALEMRPDGVGVMTYRQESSENGRATTLFWWKAAQAIPPEYVRMAFFSFTVYSDEIDEPRTKRQLDVLRKNLPKVRFGRLQEFEK